MYIICWTEKGQNTWTQIEGEDAMQQFVSDLCERLKLEPEEVMVFDRFSEL